MSTATGTPDAPASAASDDWISGRLVAQITGLPEKLVRKAGDLGHLTMRLPVPGLGGFTRYTRASAEALAASRIVRAKTTPTRPAPGPGALAGGRTDG